MRILNFGSINIDHVYAVAHFVRPGETIDSSGYEVFAGGKGFNQSIALARAGASVCHAGCAGRDGAWLLEKLRGEGIDDSGIRLTDTPTGHAMIQVEPSGENAIVLFGGANREVSEEVVCAAVSACEPGDYLLLQNETNAVALAVRQGAERGLKIVLNPAPMAPAVSDYPLDRVGLFILNETEAEALTGRADPEAVRQRMRESYPAAATVLTLGAQGAVYFDAQDEHRCPAEKVQAVDTTAAGDTFIGFFLAELMRSGDPAAALSLGCRAAAVCVTRPGASDSIPALAEVPPPAGPPQDRFDEA